MHMHVPVYTNTSIDLWDGSPDFLVFVMNTRTLLSSEETSQLFHVLFWAVSFVAFGTFLIPLCRLIFIWRLTRTVLTSWAVSFCTVLWSSVHCNVNYGCLSLLELLGLFCQHMKQQSSPNPSFYFTFFLSSLSLSLLCFDKNTDICI